MRFTKLMSKQS